MPPQNLSVKKLLRLKILLQLVVLFSISFVFVTVVNEFILRPFTVSGASMEPTFLAGEYLAIDELHYHTHPIELGDVIVFRYPLDPSMYFIKRVAGIPGDTLYGVTLGPDEYFVVGDNKGESFDSRTWGPVPRRYIIGRPLFSLYPPNRFGFLPGIHGEKFLEQALSTTTKQ